MPEQSGFQQIFRQRSAVDSHERMVYAGRIGMNRFGDQFLAGPGFAGNQDGGATGGHLGDKVEHLHHALALADNGGEAVALFQRPLQLRVLIGQALPGDYPRDFDQQLFVIPGFGQIVGGAQLHGLHGRFHRTVGGDHEHRGVPVTLPQVTQHFHAGFIGHHQIQQHQIVNPRFQLTLALGSIGREVDLVALQIQQGLQTLANLGLVVDNQDAAFGGSAHAYRRTQADTTLRGAPSGRAILCTRGNCRWKLAPSPGREVTSMAPPCS